MILARDLGALLRKAAEAIQSTDNLSTTELFDLIEALLKAADEIDPQSPEESP